MKKRYKATVNAKDRTSAGTSQDVASLHNGPNMVMSFEDTKEQKGEEEQEDIWIQLLTR